MAEGFFGSVGKISLQGSSRMGCERRRAGRERGIPGDGGNDAGTGQEDFSRQVWDQWAFGDHKCQTVLGKITEDCREGMEVIKVSFWQVYDSGGGHRARWLEIEAFQAGDGEEK